MIIDINQKKISIGDKYHVFMNGQQTHNASAKLFRLFAEINLFELPSEKPVMTIKKKFAFFTARYDITRWDGKTVEFKTYSFWKGHFRCLNGPDLYDIYKHVGRKCSIYKNNVQVAWWDKQAVTWFNGDNYTITADNDCDKNFLISLCITMDNYSSNDSEKGTINFDFGRIGPQAKKFNPDWKPKV